jgi:hypothetical protein
MSKELTAMQQLINHIQQLQDDNFISDVEYIKEKAIELLETEKQQIIDAYDESIIDYLNRNAGEFSEPKNGEKYYNQKYKP